MSRSPLNVEQSMVRALLRRKLAYERYFKSEKAIDHPAQTAYTALVKTIVEITRKAGPALDAQRPDPEEARRRADEILRNDYGIQR